MPRTEQLAGWCTIDLWLVHFLWLFTLSFLTYTMLLMVFPCKYSHCTLSIGKYKIFPNMSVKPQATHFHTDNFALTLHSNSLSSENHKASYCTQIMFLFWNVNHLYFYIHVVHLWYNIWQGHNNFLSKYVWTLLWQNQTLCRGIPVMTDQW